MSGTNSYLGGGDAEAAVTTSLVPQVGQVGGHVSAQADIEANLADILLLSDGTRMESGQVTWTGHGLAVRNYYWLDQSAPGGYTNVKPTSGLVQQLFYVEDENTIHIDVEHAHDASAAAATSSDFWRSGATGADLPDGTTDTSEDISRTGKIGLGTPTPATDIHIQKATVGQVGITVENTLVTASDYADIAAINGDVKTTLGSYKAGGYGYTGTETNNDFFIYANSNTAIVVKPNQRVGIGSDASVNNPTDTLYIANGTGGDSGLTLHGLPAATAPVVGAQPIGVDANGKVVRVATSSHTTTLATCPATGPTVAPTTEGHYFWTSTIGEKWQWIYGDAAPFVVGKYYGAFTPCVGGVAIPVNSFTNLGQLVMPRAGVVVVAATAVYSIGSGWESRYCDIFKNGILEASNTEETRQAPSLGAASVFVVASASKASIVVAAGDLISMGAQIYQNVGSSAAGTSIASTYRGLSVQYVA